jgi:dephospho-CoA kinase
MIIGIVGKSGSGKSTIAKMFKAYDNQINLIDIDKVGHEVLTLASVKEKLITAFGENVIDTNGNINRKVLSNMVFNNPIKMDLLASITWSQMELIIDGLLKGNNISILDYNPLPKTCFFQRCDIKILVDVPYEIRKARAMQRDNISGIAFDIREKASMDYSQYHFDYIINNTGNYEQMMREVGDIYDKGIVSR